VNVKTFDTREALEAKLFAMNYDDGVIPQLACLDAFGTTFLACGTDQGDEMGIAYYITNAEGYMYHYCMECSSSDIDNLISWVPTFPVSAIGADQ
jgi:hypothetical protein